MFSTPLQVRKRPVYKRFFSNRYSPDPKEGEVHLQTQRHSHSDRSGDPISAIIPSGKRLIPRIPEKNKVTRVTLKAGCQTILWKTNGSSSLFPREFFLVICEGAARITPRMVR